MSKMIAALFHNEERRSSRQAKQEEKKLMETFFVRHGLKARNFAISQE